MTHTGFTDVFIAVDAHNESHHRIRHISSKEYYHLCGYNEATSQRRWWTAMEGPEWNQLAHQTPTLKTALDRFQGVIECRLHNLPPSYSLTIGTLDRDFGYRHLAFTSCRQTTKAASIKSVGDLLLDQKYGHHPSPQHVIANRAGNTWKPLSSLDRPYEDEQHHLHTASLSATAVLEICGTSGLPQPEIYKHLCKLARLPNR